MDHIVVELRQGESIVVRVEGREVVLENQAHWLQRLTREEAWRLAEALDEMATSRDPRRLTHLSGVRCSRLSPKGSSF